MLDNLIIGNQITFLRKQNNFTQEELAEKLGITAQAISKWENGHTLPETVLLPELAMLFNCSIDSILRPFAMQDNDFHNFVSDAMCGENGELATLLYQRLRSKLNFTVTYDKKYNIFEAVFNGDSAKFNVPYKDDFIIRLDVEAGTESTNNMALRIPLRNCSKYMNLIDKMPEHIKCNFRCSDCKSCTCNCPYCMVYNFEGTDYKQCHFISIPLNSYENMEHALALICAEHEMCHSDKMNAK